MTRLFLQAFDPSDGAEPVLARYLRIRHVEPMSAIWEVMDFVVHGVKRVAQASAGAEGGAGN